MITDNNSDVKTVEELADEEMRLQIVLIVYLIILCVSGTIGNILVCYIFTKKFTKSTYRIFVIVLALVDLFTSGFIIPLELLQFFWQYTYDSVLACKLNLFLKTWSTVTSGILLLWIAIDRYRRICRPLSLQISISATKYMCTASALLGVFFSWISPVMYSVQTKKLDAYNLTISECAITRPMKKTWYPLIHNVSFGLLFVAVLLIIITLYSLIAVRVKRQLGKKLGETSSRVGTNQIEMGRRAYNTSCKNESKLETIDFGNSTNGSPSAISSYQKTNLDNVETDDQFKHLGVSTSNSNQACNRKSSLNKRNKTTWIMFWISLAFIFSYLPLLCISLITFADQTFVASLSDTERAVYKFFYRSYFFNSAVNPVIYGVLDNRFKKSCKEIFVRRK